MEKTASMATSPTTSATLPLSAQARGHERPALLRRLNLSLSLGLMLLALVLIGTLGASLIARHDPNQTFPGMSLMPPQRDFVLGTDSIGRDVFARVLYGGRVSLSVAVPSVAMALALGLLLGLPAGYLGGRVDQVIMRLLDILFAFPAILLAITMVAILGASVRNLVITIGIIYAPRMARIVRAPTMSVKERDFIEAARALGAPDLRVVLRHVLPNVSSPVIVEVSLALGQVIITETALSFLGLGPPPPNPSWGAMLSDSRQFMEFASWTVWAPGAAIVLATASFLLVGHGLREALNPRQQGR
jgi:peptide/nickel transport system permease protein